MSNETLSIIFTVSFFVLVIRYFMVMTKADPKRPTFDDLDNRFDEIDYSNIDSFSGKFDTTSWRDDSTWDFSTGSSVGDAGSFGDASSDGGGGGGD